MAECNHTLIVITQSHIHGKTSAIDTSPPILVGTQAELLMCSKYDCLQVFKADDVIKLNQERYQQKKEMEKKDGSTKPKSTIITK